MAYNEAASIQSSLSAILDDPENGRDVDVVMVVCSGCTDDTADIVRRVAAVDSRVRLIEEETRSGKSAAINRFLAEVPATIYVLVGADVLFAPGALSRLLRPFEDLAVGMTGAHPVPTNRPSSFVGRAVRLLWMLHHEVALERPKMGEAIAFRPLSQPLHPDLFDEPIVEYIVQTNGGSVQYVPDAVVYNHGPETLSEFLLHRRRNYDGQRRLERKTRYRVATLESTRSLRASLRVLSRHPGELMTLLGLLACEAWIRLQTRLWPHRNPSSNGIWRPISTAKTVLLPGQRVRRYVDTTTTIRIFPLPGTRTRRSHLRSLRRAVATMVRADDRVRRRTDRLEIELRADALGAQCAVARLRRNLAGEAFVTGGALDEAGPIKRDDLVDEAEMTG